MPASSATNQAIWNRYGNGAKFLKTFEAANQYRYCKDVKRVFMGTAPTLAALSDAYGESVAESFVELQLIDLSEFSGARVKMDVQQIDQTARVIISQFPFFKATELMYFFLQFKAGKYGKFYGAVDGLVITEALQEFKRERNEAIYRYQDEEEEQRKAIEQAEHEARVREFHNALAVCNMTIQEWIEINRHIHINLSNEEIRDLGWLFRMGYEPWRVANEHNNIKTSMKCRPEERDLKRCSRTLWKR